MSITFLLLQSCTSGNNENVNNGNSIILCKHKVFSNGSSWDYSYDGNKILMVKTGNSVILKYYYTGDLITKVETFDTNQIATRNTYIYNSANQLINEISVNYLPDPNNPAGNKTDYTYNSNNTISFIYYLGLPGQYSIHSSGVIYLNNGEITSVNENYQNNVPNTSVMTRTYDNKNSPFKNILGINKILTRNGAGGGFQSRINNPITIGFTNNNLISYSYQYNEQGYPVSEYVTNSNSSSTSSCQYYY